MKVRRNKEEIKTELKLRNTIKAKANPDGLKIACVFSCPGQEEEKTGEFLSGVTGTNFLTLINILNIKAPDIFSSVEKEKYHINNSSDHVYYEGYLNDNDGRSTPYIFDIKSDENKNRLVSELEGMSYVIAFGNDAEIALKNAGIGYVKAKCHLGTKGLNSLEYETCVTTEKKLEDIADDLIKKIQGC